MGNRKLLGERGATAVEFALVAPIVFLLLFAVIDFGFGFSANLAISNAAREGARLAAVDRDPDDVADAVMAAVQSLDPDRVSVSVDCTTTGGADCGGLESGSSGDRATVTVDYTYNVLTPISTIIGSTLDLRSSSVMRIE